MNVALHDYDALVISYKGIYNPSLKIKLIVKRYLIAIGQLENKIDSLDVNYSYNIKLDSNINYFIGKKLLNDLYEAVETENKEQEKVILEKLKKETRRIDEYTLAINETSFNSCKITKKQAKEIMLQYMSEEEINNDILELYPETTKEILMRNQVCDSLTDRFKDGTIVKKKMNIIKKKVTKRF